MTSAKAKNIYFLPLEDKFIIYLPFKPLAFIGNAAMVDSIQRDQAGAKPDDVETRQLLQNIGFYAPDQRRMTAERAEAPFKPTIAVLLLTTACNLNCVYCYASAGSGAGQTMPFSVGQAVIDQVCRNAQELNKKSFSLCLHGGGEPTVVKKLLRNLVSYAHGREVACSISLTTNGFIKENDIDDLLQGISEVSLSFDGMAPIQNKQRPAAGNRPSFDRVYQTLQVIEQKKIPYGIRMSVMDDSIAALPENIKFLCENTNCHVFQVEPVFNSGQARTQNNYLKDNERFIDAFMTAMEIAFAHGRHMYYSGVRPWLVTSTFCRAPYDALIANHNSELTACYEVYDKSHELGELFFYGRATATGEFQIDLSKRRRLMEKIQNKQAECVSKECFCYSHCAGDCPPKAFLAEEPDGSGFSRRCELNRALTKEMLLFYLEKSGGIWRGEKIEKR